MNTIEVLSALEELFSDPSRWTKGKMARETPSGDECRVDSERATSWCMSGGLWRILRSIDYGSSIAYIELRNTINAGGRQKIGSLCEFNDVQTSIEPVLDVIRETKKRLQKDVVSHN